MKLAKLKLRTRVTQCTLKKPQMCFTQLKIVIEKLKLEAIAHITLNNAVIQLKLQFIIK